MNLDNLELRQIKIFITAVSSGSFSKCGEKLFMTQSMVSKSIASMEKTLGLKLFTRNSRGIELTPAGKVIYYGWKNLLPEMEKIVIAAVSTEQGCFKQIYICDFNTTIKKEYLWPYLSEFKLFFPDVDIMLETVNPENLFKKMESGNCDIVFAPVWQLPLFQRKEYNWKYIFKRKNCVWIHESNPLYKRQTVSLCDLKDEVFIFASPLFTHYEKWIIDMCRQAGFEPKNILRVADSYAANMHLKLGHGIIIRDSFFDSANTEDVKIFGLDDTEHGGIILVWKKDHSSTIKKFVNLYNKAL